MYKILFVIGVVLTVMSCGELDPGSSFSGSTVAAPIKNKKVGILLFGESHQSQVSGFKYQMRQFGYEEGENIHYTTQNAKSAHDNLVPLAEELVEKGVDLLVAAGGMEADVIKKVAEKAGIPVVVLFTNGIVERKLVKSKEETGWSVTGIDNLNAELSGKRVELISTLLPNAKNILILYQKDISSARVGLAYALRAAKELGLTIDARPVSSRGDISLEMRNLKKGEVDAMLIVPDGPIEDALTDVIIPNADRLRLPLFGFSRSMVASGVLASFSTNNYNFGLQGAELADKIFNGVAIETLGFETPKKYSYAINLDIMQKLSIKLSEKAKSEINEFVELKEGL